MDTPHVGSLDPSAPRHTVWMWIVLVFGLTSVANALWMLVGPMHWYTDIPVAVPDTGPFNPHFVRDIGGAFLTAGISLVWAFFSPRYRFPLVSMGAVFLGAHALVHAYDTLRGALGHDHWILDLPGVYLPGLLLPLIAYGLGRKDRSTS